MSYISSTPALYLKTGHVMWPDAVAAYPAAHSSLQEHTDQEAFYGHSSFTFTRVCITNIHHWTHFLTCSWFSVQSSLHISRLINLLPCLKTGVQQINVCFPPCIDYAQLWMLRILFGIFMCFYLREKISLASLVSSYRKMNTLDASCPWWCNWFLYGQGSNPSKHLKNCDCSEATRYGRIVTSNITRLASNLYFMSFFSLLFYPISNLPKQNFGFMQFALVKSIIFILLLFSFLQ